MKVFRLIFIDDWKNGYWIFAVVAFLFDVVLPNDLVSLNLKIIILSITLTVGFILKLIFQILNYQETDFHCKGYNIGSGLYENVELIKIIRDSRLQINLLLVLYDYSTTISSPVALIKIVEINKVYAYGIKLSPENRKLSEIIGLKDVSNFILKNKVDCSTLDELSKL